MKCADCKKFMLTEIINGVGYGVCERGGRRARVKENAIDVWCMGDDFEPKEKGYPTTEAYDRL